MSQSGFPLKLSLPYNFEHLDNVYFTATARGQGHLTIILKCVVKSGMVYPSSTPI
jgi:hypothetical protein